MTAKEGKVSTHSSLETRATAHTRISTGSVRRQTVTEGQSRPCALLGRNSKGGDRMTKCGLG